MRDYDRVFTDYDKARIEDARSRHPDKPDFVIVNSLKKNYSYSAEEAWNMVYEYRARYLPPSQFDTNSVIKMRRKFKHEGSGETLGDILAQALTYKKPAQPKLLVIFEGKTSEYFPGSEAEAQRVISLVKFLLNDVEIYVKA